MICTTSKAAARQTHTQTLHIVMFRFVVSHWSRHAVRPRDFLPRIPERTACKRHRGRRLTAALLLRATVFKVTAVRAVCAEGTRATLITLTGRLPFPFLLSVTVYDKWNATVAGGFSQKSLDYCCTLETPTNFNCSLWSPREGSVCACVCVLALKKYLNNGFYVISYFIFPCLLGARSTISKKNLSSWTFLFILNLSRMDQQWQQLFFWMTYNLFWLWLYTNASVFQGALYDPCLGLVALFCHDLLTCDFTLEPDWCSNTHTCWLFSSIPRKRR